MRSLLDVVLFAAGYIAATYSRPSIRMWVNGARAEIASFRAMAALESSIRVR